jgi:poly(A) polymerase
MRLRADIGEVDVVLADWWQEFSQASDAVREDLVAQLREEQHKGQRRVRAQRPVERIADLAQEAPGPEHVQQQQQTGGDFQAREGDASDAPRKRRRRRRKPLGEGGAQPAGEPAGGAAED